MAHALDDPNDYAEALVLRARGRLDPQTLHAWMVQRLVVDLALEHERAVQVSDALISRRRHHL